MPSSSSTSPVYSEMVENEMMSPTTMTSSVMATSRTVDLASTPAAAEKWHERT